MWLRQNVLTFGENVAMAKIAKKAKVPQVKEPATPYLKSPNTLRSAQREGEQINSKSSNNKINHWLGGNSLLGPISSEFDLINAGQKGIAKASVDALANYLGVSRKVMAEDIFDLSVKTMERKSAKDKMDRRTSAHALEIAKVVQHAYEVFEDEEKLKHWVNKENKALNGTRPVLLLSTLTGINMVNDVLGRIEEGIYS